MATCSRPAVSRRRVVLLAAAAAAAPLGGAAAQPQPPPPTVKLTAGVHLISAELARDDAARTRGLMFRESLPPNGGMLFVFDHKATQCMWMRNTLIPLAVAFIADDGSIVNIEEMKPRDETTRHCSHAPVRYALEMTQGWFSQRGLKAGSRIGGLPR
jgi:uncharacterized protein